MADVSRGRHAAICRVTPQTHTNTSLFTASDFETLHVLLSRALPGHRCERLALTEVWLAGRSQHAWLEAFGTWGLFINAAVERRAGLLCKSIHLSPADMVKQSNEHPFQAFRVLRDVPPRAWRNRSCLGGASLGMPLHSRTGQWCGAGQCGERVWEGLPLCGNDSSWRKMKVGWLS